MEIPRLVVMAAGATAVRETIVLVLPKLTDFQASVPCQILIVLTVVVAMSVATMAVIKATVVTTRVKSALMVM